MGWVSIAAAIVLLAADPELPAVPPTTLAPQNARLTEAPPPAPTPWWAWTALVVVVAGGAAAAALLATTSSGGPGFEPGAGSVEGTY